MPGWMIKELSNLATVSIHTLHYYDKIGLLKPSLRQKNGFRIYSQNDLKKLQLIVAFKYLGCNLKQIKLLLEKKLSLFDQLSQQRSILLQKEVSIRELRKAVELILINSNKKISATEIINITKGYSMKQNYDDSWMKDVFSEKILSLMKEEEKNLLDIPEREWFRYGQDWENLIDDVNLHISEDPNSKVGKFYAQKWLNLAYKYWKNTETGNARWEALKQHKIPHDAYGWPKLSDEMVSWIEKAIRAHNIKPSM